MKKPIIIRKEEQPVKTTADSIPLGQGHPKSAFSEGVQLLNTPCFSVQNTKETRELVQAALAKMSVKDFNFTRVFDNGTAFRLSTNASLEQYSATNEIHLVAHVPADLLKERFWFYFSESSPYSSALKALKELTGISSCVNYIDRSVGYFDMYSFFAGFDQSIAASRFIELKEHLENQSYRFLEKGDSLISKASQSRFVVPKKMLPNFKSLSRQNPQGLDADLSVFIDKICREIYFRTRGTPMALSDRQLECIRFTLMGKTSAEVAEKLGISFRTVENYLASIREKFNCQSRSELIETLLRTPLSA